MPCRYDDDGSQIIELSNRVNELEGQVDQLEGMLCEAIQFAEEEHGHDITSFKAALLRRDPRLLQWYERHEAEETDKVRKEAAQKLTARERRLLGIDANGNPTASPKPENVGAQQWAVLALDGNYISTTSGWTRDLTNAKPFTSERDAFYYIQTMQLGVFGCTPVLMPKKAQK